jgi:hypothetical protein
MDDQGQNFPPVLRAAEAAADAVATEDNPNQRREHNGVDEETESGAAAKAAVDDSGVSSLASPDGPGRVVYVNEDALSRRALRGMRVLRILDKVE